MPLAARVRAPTKPIGAVVALVLSLSGCADLATVRREAAGVPGDAVELTDTPFFAQAEYQCGPAALATLLVSAGRRTSPAQLVDRIYLPGREGSLQVELLGATRREGLIAYLIDPTVEALIAELLAGRPVLILQNLGIRSLPVWHYAVVIGYDPSAGDMILRSGTTRRETTPIHAFLRTWERADFWGFLVLRPDELPARPNRSRYLEAVSALEAVGQFQAALTAYRTALQQWPADATALLGTGNSLYGLGDLSAAEKAYRRVIAANPHNLVGYNNLAQVLAEQGRHAQAHAAIREGLSVSSPKDQLRAVLLKTEQEILRKRGG